MSVKVSKSKVGHINTDRLSQEIADDVKIVTVLDYIDGLDLTANDFDLYFASTLSGAEDTALDAVITNHTKAPLPSVKTYIASTDPTANDDEGPGTPGFFKKGSNWINDVSGITFELHDQTDAAAVWVAFGSICVASESEGDSTTTSGTFQEKLTLTTPNLASGNYVLFWQAELEHESDTDMEVQLQQNDTTVLGLLGAESSVSDSPELAGAIRCFTGISGVQDFDIDFRVSSGAGTITIKRARMVFWRTNA